MFQLWICSSKKLHIAHQHCHSHISSSLNPFCLLFSLPVNPVRPQQLDSSHSHQFDITLFKPFHKKARGLRLRLSLGNEKAELSKHLSWRQHNSRMVAQQPSSHTREPGASSFSFSASDPTWASSFSSAVWSIRCPSILFTYPLKLCLRIFQLQLLLGDLPGYHLDLDFVQVFTGGGQRLLADRMQAMQEISLLISSPAAVLVMWCCFCKVLITTPLSSFSSGHVKGWTSISSIKSNFSEEVASLGLVNLMISKIVWALAEVGSLQATALR